MRIDNRKVNGKITLEPTDLMTGFTILIQGDNPGWF